MNSILVTTTEATTVQKWKHFILNPMMHGNFAKIYLHSSYSAPFSLVFSLALLLYVLVLVFLNVCAVHYCYCVVFMHTFSNFFFQLSLLRTTFKCFHRPQIETQIAKNGPHWKVTVSTARRRAFTWNTKGKTQIFYYWRVKCLYRYILRPTMQKKEKTCECVRIRKSKD